MGEFTAYLVSEHVVLLRIMLLSYLVLSTQVATYPAVGAQCIVLL